MPYAAAHRSVRNPHVWRGSIFGPLWCRNCSACAEDAVEALWHRRGCVALPPPAVREPCGALPVVAQSPSRWREGDCHTLPVAIHSPNNAGTSAGSAERTKTGINHHKKE